MSERVELVARKRRRLHGRLLEVGERFNVSRMDARLWKALRWAEDAPAEIPSKQQYQTRDMRAGEPPKQVNPPPVADQVDDEPTKLRAELDRRGIKYHHRAGVAKLRQLLDDQG